MLKLLIGPACITLLEKTLFENHCQV